MNTSAGWQCIEPIHQVEKDAFLSLCVYGHICISLNCIVLILQTLRIEDDMKYMNYEKKWRGSDLCIVQLSFKPQQKLIKSN